MRFVPVNLKTKIPTMKEWTTNPPIKVNTAEELKKHEEIHQGLALVLDENVIAMDVDPRNGGDDSFRVLTEKKFIDFRICRCIVCTPGLGAHYYFSRPHGMTNLKTTSQDLPGIELLSVGRSITIPSQRNQGHQYVRGSIFDSHPPLPAEIASFFFRSSAAPAAPIPDEPIFTSRDQGLTPDQCIMILKYLDASDFGEYQRWFSLLAAYKGSGGRLSDFISWCCTDINYPKEKHERQITAQWRGVSGERGRTHKSLRYFYAQAGGDIDALEGREKNIIEPSRSPPKKAPKKEKPKWEDKFKDWVYVDGIGRFFNRRLGYWNSRSDILLTLARETKGYKITELLIDGSLSTVTGLTFSPGDGPTINKKGDLYVNCWVDPGVTRKKGDVSIFLGFLRHFWGDDSEHALDWMAAVTQRIRVRYMLLVHSSENQVGKSSFIGAVMRKICGPKNTVMLNESLVTGTHNGYLTRTHLGIIEELYAGSKKMALYNVLKQQITEPVLTVNQKYIDQFQIENNSVYLAFTNYLDAVAMTDNDPRMLVLSTHRKPLAPGKYRDLASWMKKGGYEALYDYLLDREVSDLDYSAAPSTKSKDQMVLASHNPTDIFLEEEILCRFSDFVCPKYIREKFPNHFPTQKSTYHLGRSLRKKGYSSQQVRVDGRVCYVYSKSLDHKEIKRRWDEMRNTFPVHIM